jgi:hypothetical protein
MSPVSVQSIGQDRGSPVNRIYWADLPEANERGYRHPGCTFWIVPLDDCPPPATPRSCEGCGFVFEVEPQPIPVIRPWRDR